MNKHERYVEVCKQMEMLKITDVTTNRQHRNGTRVWRLPIKYSTHQRFIEVASFKTGYVRNQNGGYTNYQLNKRCDSGPQYYPDYEHTKIDGEWVATKTGKYNKYTTRACVMIPNEIDRLEYLITYCLKNYYIKLANQVVDGKYIQKWQHEHELAKANGTYSENTGAMHRIGDLEEKLEMTQNEYKNRAIEVDDLQMKMMQMIPKWKYDEAMNKNHELDCGHYDRIKELESDVHNLENKLATIERIANDKNKWNG